MKAIQTNTQVQIVGMDVPSKSGLGVVVNATPNAYGLIKVKLYPAKGYSDFNDYGFYSPSELKVKK